jgi:hypothetical protein
VIEAIFDSSLRREKLPGAARSVPSFRAEHSSRFSLITVTMSARRALQWDEVAIGC